MSSSSSSSSSSNPTIPEDPMVKMQRLMEDMSSAMIKVTNEVVGMSTRMANYEDALAHLHQDAENARPQIPKTPSDSASVISDGGYSLGGVQDEAQDPSAPASAKLSNNQKKKLKAKAAQEAAQQKAVEEALRAAGVQPPAAPTGTPASVATQPQRSGAVASTPAASAAAQPPTAMRDLLKTRDVTRPTGASILPANIIGTTQLQDMQRLHEFRQLRTQNTVRTHTKFDGKLLQSDFSLHDLLAKRKEMTIFMSRHQCPVYWDDVCSEPLKTRIMMRFGDRKPTTYFCMITEEDVWLCLVALKEPRDEVEFSAVLADYKPTNEYLQCKLSSANLDSEWMDLTNQHIDGFLEVLEALMLCRPEHCPEVWTNTKNPADGFDRSSLASIFLKTFPNSYGKGIHKLLPNNMKRGTFAEYIKAIRDQLEKEGEINRLSTSQRRFIKTAYVARTGKTSSGEERLHALEFDDFYRPPSQILTREDPFEEELHALVSAKASETKLPQGCFKVIKHGLSGCPDGLRCKYSHKSEDLDRTCDWMITHHKKELDLLNQRCYRSSHVKFANNKPAAKLHALAASYDDRSPNKTVVHQEVSDSEVEEQSEDCQACNT